MTRPRYSGLSSSSRSNARNPRITFFDGSVRSTLTISMSGRHAATSASSSRTVDDSPSCLIASTSIDTGYARTQTNRPPQNTAPSASATRSPINSTQHRRKLCTSRLVCNPTISLERRPLKIASRIATGSTFMYLGSGHGT